MSAWDLIGGFLRVIAVCAAVAGNTTRLWASPSIFVKLGARGSWHGGDAANDHGENNVRLHS